MFGREVCPLLSTEYITIIYLSKGEQNENGNNNNNINNSRISSKKNI